MFKMFKPKMYYKDIFSINYNKLQAMGIRCLLFDLDNTIEPIFITLPDEKDINFFDYLKNMGFEIIIMSNSKKERVSIFAKRLGVNYNSFSMKPFIKNYLLIMHKYKYKNSEIAAIGDQLMTDIYGANNIKIISILVDQISEVEEHKTKFNRLLEKLILNHFKARNIFIKGNYYE